MRSGTSSWRRNFRPGSRSIRGRKFTPRGRVREASRRVREPLPGGVPEAIPEGGSGTGSEPEPTPKKSRKKCPPRGQDPPGLPHVSGSKTLVTLCPEKNVNLAHTYTLVGRVGIAIPRPRSARFPGRDPGGSGAWNRPQKLRSGPGPGRGPGTGSWVRFVGPGPTPRDGDPRTQVRRSGPGSQDRGSAVRGSVSIDAIDRRRC
jgi:hypothetical protein